MATMDNTEEQRRILKQIAECEGNISALRKARIEAALTGYASASISSSGGSKSYTRISLAEITALLKQLTRELAALKNLLATGNAQKGIIHRYITWG